MNETKARAEDPKQGKIEPGSQDTSLKAAPTRRASGRKKVVIVGGGFGGLYAAKSLAGKEVDVILIDKKNHHTFQPLLYQVATTVLSPGQIASPLRTVLTHADNVEVLLDELVGIDLEQRHVCLAKGDVISYDYLVLAAGARHSYFGHDEWEEFAPGIKTLEDAIHVRRQILLAFERAEREAFLKEGDDNLSFAVVGGGPTGVEIAGAIADIANRVVAPDFKTIDTRKTRVMLFEAAPRILGMFPEDLSQKAKVQLEQLKVEVLTDSPVETLEAGRIKVKGEWIPVRVIVWATGVSASPIGKMLGIEVDKAGRVPVQPDLTLKDRSEVFVIGDMSSLKDTAGVQVPGLAAAAIQEGAYTAKNILADLAGEARRPFTYKDKGTLATIGRNRAVALFGKVELSGFAAWLLWALVHIYLLIGFRNRLTVMREWIWSYITGERSARLITGNDV
jgi:NADH dehydrogenase